MALAALFSLGNCQASSQLQDQIVTANLVAEFADMPPEIRDRAAKHVSTAMVRGLRQYRLTAGDLLEASYHFDTQVLQSVFPLGVGDEVEIDFRSHPDYSRRVVIRPDGRISLPGRGGIMAAGKSPEALAETIAKTYEDVIVQPVVTVIVQKFRTQVDDLKEVLTRSTQSRVMQVQIEPDGKINVPLLPPVQASAAP